MNAVTAVGHASDVFVPLIRPGCDPLLIASYRENYWKVKRPKANQTWPWPKGLYRSIPVTCLLKARNPSLPSQAGIPRVDRNGLTLFKHLVPIGINCAWLLTPQTLNAPTRWILWRLDWAFSSLFSYVKPRAFVHEAAATPGSVEGVVHCYSHQQNDPDLNLTARSSVSNHKDSTTLRLHSWSVPRFAMTRLGLPFQFNLMVLDHHWQRMSPLTPKCPYCSWKMWIHIYVLLNALSRITLSLNDEGSKREAEKQWASLRVFIVISYHPGCNSIHQRRPH